MSAPAVALSPVRIALPKDALSVALACVGLFAFRLQDALIKAMGGDPSIFRTAVIRRLAGAPLVLAI